MIRLARTTVGEDDVTAEGVRLDDELNWMPEVKFLGPWTETAARLTLVFFALVLLLLQRGVGHKLLCPPDMLSSKQRRYRLHHRVGPAPQKHKV